MAKESAYKAKRGGDVGAAQRDAGLAHAPREPALGEREPADHGLAARRRRERAADAGGEECGERGLLALDLPPAIRQLLHSPAQLKAPRWPIRLS